MNRWKSEILSNPDRTAIPIMTHPGIEYIGKSVKSAVTDGRIHYQAVEALDKRFPSGACTLIMDLTTEAEAFGAEIVFPEEEIPIVTSRLLNNKEEVEALAIPDMSKGRLREYLKAARLAAENIKGKPVLGGCIGPFSLAGRLYDLSELMMACYCEPDTAKLLLDKCTEFLVSYCIELKKQGVDGIIAAEPAAGLLSPEGCFEFSSVYVRRMVDAVQDENFAIILHNCGNRGSCTDAMVATGAFGYHFGNQIDMIAALDQCPADVPVMGNIDPVRVFMNANSDEMRQTVLDLLNRTSAYPNFVLSSGCDVPPRVPVNNIQAFYDALKEYNQTKREIRSDA